MHLASSIHPPYPYLLHLHRPYPPQFPFPPSRIPRCLAHPVFLTFKWTANGHLDRLRHFTSKVLHGTFTGSSRARGKFLGRWVPGFPCFTNEWPSTTYAGARLLPPASHLAVRQAASSKSLRTFPQDLTPAQMRSTGYSYHGNNVTRRTDALALDDSPHLSLSYQTSFSLHGNLHETFTDLHGPREFNM